MELCTFSKANPVSLSCFIVERRQILILRRVLKDLSAPHDVTGKTNVWINIFLMLGNTNKRISILQRRLCCFWQLFFFKVCTPKLKLGFHCRMSSLKILTFHHHQPFHWMQSMKEIIPKHLIAMIESGVNLLSISSFR